MSEHQPRDYIRKLFEMYPKSRINSYNAPVSLKDFTIYATHCGLLKQGFMPNDIGNVINYLNSIADDNLDLDLSFRLEAGIVYVEPGRLKEDFEALASQVTKKLVANALNLIKQASDRKRMDKLGLTEKKLLLAQINKATQALLQVSRVLGEAEFSDKNYRFGRDLDMRIKTGKVDVDRPTSAEALHTTIA